MTTMDMAAPPAGIDAEKWYAAQRTVRNYCRWHIAPSVTETLTLDATGGTLLRLPSAYVTDVVSVTRDGTLLDPGDYEWSQHGMIRGRWPYKFRSVVVELTHGYDLCPDDVYDVLTHMVESATVLAASGAGVAGMLVSGPHTMQVSASAAAGATGLSGHHRGVLDRYRLAPSP